jgi:hypothetical protein
METSEAFGATESGLEGKGLLDLERSLDVLGVACDLEDLMELFSSEEPLEVKARRKEKEVSLGKQERRTEEERDESEVNCSVSVVVEQDEAAGCANEAEREVLKESLNSLLPSVNLNRVNLPRGLPVGLGRVMVPFQVGSKVVVIPSEQAQRESVRRSRRLGGEVKRDEGEEAFEPVRQFASLEHVWEDVGFEGGARLSFQLSRSARGSYRAWATRRWRQKRRGKQGTSMEVNSRVNKTLRILKKKAYSNGGRFGSYLIPTVHSRK